MLGGLVEARGPNSISRLRAWGLFASLQLVSRLFAACLVFPARLFIQALLCWGEVGIIEDYKEQRHASS